MDGKGEFVSISPSFKSKFLAAFVVAFVCLNAGGAFCATYCGGFITTALIAARGPLAKNDDHCKKVEQERKEVGDSINASSSIDCCPMISGFIPGPLEQKQHHSTAPFAKQVAIFTPRKLSNALAFEQLTNIRYRGPPKAEHGLYIRNSILRI